MKSLASILTKLETQLEELSTSHPPHLSDSPSLPNAHQRSRSRDTTNETLHPIPPTQCGSHESVSHRHAEGEQEIIEVMTIRGSPAVSREALNSRLVELSEDDEFESFVARVPISFGSHIVSDISTMLDLMTYPGGGDVAFTRPLPEHFRTLLADPSDIDYLLTDKDLPSRVITLCIGSPPATKVVENGSLPDGQSPGV